MLHSQATSDLFDGLDLSCIETLITEQKIRTSVSNVRKKIKKEEEEEKINKFLIQKKQNEIFRHERVIKKWEREYVILQKDFDPDENIQKKKRFLAEAIKRSLNEIEKIEEEILLFENAIKSNEETIFNLEIEVDKIRPDFNEGEIIWDHLSFSNISNPLLYQSYKTTGIDGLIKNKFQGFIMTEYANRRSNFKEEIKKRLDPLQTSKNPGKQLVGFLGEFLMDTFV